MNAPGKLGVAVVGLGVGEQHARAFWADARCEVRWLCDLDAARVQALAGELKAGVAPDFAAVVNRPDVDIISLASYDDDHAAQVEQALKAGKHVFVEKPLCQTLAQLRAIQQAWAAQAGRLKLASNLVLRAAPLYRWLRDAVRSGAFGQVYAFDGDYLYGRLHKITEGWRSQVKNYSVMEGGGIHLLDLFLWITGERPQTVSAAGNRLCSAGTAFQYNDFAAATFQAASGLVARITANFGCIHRHQHVVRLFGTQGTFLYDDAGPRVHWTRDPAVAASPVLLSALPAAKGDLIPAFVSAVCNNADLSADTQCFFDGLSLSAACDQSLQSGKLEAIDYV